MMVTTESYDDSNFRTESYDNKQSVWNPMMATSVWNYDGKQLQY